jgi:BCD family chlorophyll transporter-like MFS transporter
MGERRRLLVTCLSAAVSSGLLAGPFTQIGIAQLHLPATLVAGLVALHSLTAVLRPRMGRLSDRHRFWGGRRRGYLRLGLLVVWTVLPLPLLGLLTLGQAWPELDPLAKVLAVALEAALVGLLGSGNQLVQTMLGARLLEISPPSDRGRAIRELFMANCIAAMVVALGSSLLLSRWSAWPLAARMLGLWCVWGSLTIPAVLWSQAVPEREPLSSASAQAGAAKPSSSPQPDPPLLRFMVVSYAALFVQEVLLEPYATERLGWILAATTSLGGSWAVGTILGLLLSRRGLTLPRLGLVGTAIGYGLLAWGGVGTPLILPPLTLQAMSLGVMTGLIQAWIAEQIGRRCSTVYLGEQAGGWGAVLVLSRSFGLLLSGPLLDWPQRLLMLASGPSFAMAFLVAAGMVLCGLMIVPAVNRHSSG